jgi:hypothetical protein
MRDPSFFLVWFIMMFGVSLLSSASPLVGRFLVQSAFARIALVIAVVLSGVALLIGVAYSNEMTPRKAFLIAAGIAPLHQLLLLRYLYGRFIERNGRTPQFVGRSSPQADKTFAVTNILLGAFPYLVLGLIIGSLAKLGR